VIGIARDSKYVSLAEVAQPFMYRPFSQHPRTRMTLVVQSTGDAAALAPAIRAEAAAIDASVPMFDVRTLEDLYRARALAPPRNVALVASALGLLALVLATVGLYGVIAFLTARRTHEIGIRVAVGASPRRVLGIVLTQAAGPVAIGLGVGIGLALLLAPLVGSPAFDFVVPSDATVFVLVPVAIGAIALSAAAIPALRAIRVDPVAALRAE
jgi:putative ABC transport system permease protein